MLELRKISLVTLHIEVDLRDPIFTMALRHSPEKAPLMRMPEAASNFYDFSPAAHHDVGFSGQTGNMQSVSVPHPVNKAANYQFWFSVLGTDPGHDFAATFFRARVCHRIFFRLMPSLMRQDCND
jgi:hypothetical protein